MVITGEFQVTITQTSVRFTLCFDMNYKSTCKIHNKTKSTSDLTLAIQYNEITEYTRTPDNNTLVLFVFLQVHK